MCIVSLSLYAVIVGFLVVIVSLLILFFNIELPNELKGFIFYAQVKFLTLFFHASCIYMLLWDLYAMYIVYSCDLKFDIMESSSKLFI